MSTGQYAVRLFCGLGLLLLPAVQQKVCTWPVPKDKESRRPAESPSAPTSRQQPKQKTKNPLTLAAMLPDVAPPRRPNHAHLTVVQRGRPLPVTTWVSGPAGSDDQAADPIGNDTIFADGWPRNPAPQRLPTFGNAGVRLVRAHRLLFATSILKTGPPHA